MKAGAIDLVDNLGPAIRNLDSGQQLSFTGEHESFLVTKLGKDFILSHDNLKLTKTSKSDVIVRTILREKSGPLVAIHPKADKKLLKGWGLSPEIVIS